MLTLVPNVDTCTKCWHLYQMLTLVSNVDNCTKCWHSYQMLTLVPNVDTCTKCWHLNQMLTLVPNVDNSTKSWHLYQSWHSYQMLILVQSWHLYQKNSLLRCSPSPPPPHHLLVSTQASHGNYLLWIYKMHSPLLILLNWARCYDKSAVKLEENLSPSLTPDLCTSAPV